MSELKAFVARKIDDGTCDPVPCVEVYRKSEADKVITLLKDKANYNEYAYKHKSEELADTCRFYEKELCHQKYKQCFAMAKWCKDKIDAIQNGYIRSNIESQNGVMTTCPPECNPKFSFYFKWHNRWMELAEKFKEAK